MTGDKREERERQILDSDVQRGELCHLSETAGTYGYILRGQALIRPWYEFEVLKFVVWFRASPGRTVSISDPCLHSLLCSLSAD